MGGTLNKFILLFMLLGMAINGHTQSVFNKAYDEGNISNSTPNVLEAFGSYFFVQKIFKNNSTYLEAVNLDTKGVILKKNTLVAHPSLNIYYGHSGSLQYLSTQEFCQLYHMALDSTVDLVFFNQNLQVTRTINFSFNFFLNAAVIKQINDTTLLTLGRIQNSNTFDLFLINTDLQGKERWRTTFGKHGEDDYGYGVEYINNNIIIGGQTYDNNNIAHPHIFVLDINGQLNFDTTYADYNNGGELAYHSKYGLYLASSINIPNGTRPALLKINTDYTLDWGKVYFNNKTISSLSNLVITENGMITMVGTELNDNEFIGLFFQANHMGDSLGSKLIEHLPGERAAFYDIRRTSDGGYIMAGETSAPSQDSWIVKVNAWGCDNIPCVVGVEEIVEEKGSLLCYPNPTASNGVIKGFVEHTKDTRVIIYNSLGQEVHTLEVSQTDFEIAINLPAQGIYLVVLVQNGKVLKRQKWVVE